MTQMFIPKKLRVGFQTRPDTFSGKLAYVIYYDEKGNIRKEASWKSWCDKDTETLEIDNLPQVGYILNKGVKRDGYWGSGRSVIRVHDPRDFEFEISVDNLMGILMHSDVSKRDIQEQCVFAWAGTELVLLPVNSQEYIDSVAYTAKQDQKISSKDFVAGYTYQPKKSDHPLIYMGYYEWFDWDNGYQYQGKLHRKPQNHNYSSANYYYEHVLKGKKHVFYNSETKTFTHKNASDFSSIISFIIADNYPSLVEDFYATQNSQKIVQVMVSDEQKPYYDTNILFFVENNNLITSRISYRNHYNANDIQGYSVVFDLNFYAETLEYKNSLKKGGQHSVNTSFTRDITKEFQSKFGTPFLQEKYKDIVEEIKNWLIDKGFGKNYSYVLNNNKVVSN